MYTFPEEQRNRILKAEVYYEHPKRVRRESQRLARNRQIAIAKAKKEPSINDDNRDETYWDVVLSALRMGQRTGDRDNEGKEIWSFDD